MVGWGYLNSLGALGALGALSGREHPIDPLPLMLTYHLYTKPWRNVLDSVGSIQLGAERSVAFDVSEDGTICRGELT